jgi:hypothetical protein
MEEGIIHIQWQGPYSGILAPRRGLEPRTFRLTASSVILPKLAGIGLNRGQSASCDETRRVLFSFSTHLLFTLCHHLPGLA